MSKRAITPSQKRAVVERILVAWLQSPQQRLGQLIFNSAYSTGDLFFIEDDTLAECVESFVRSGDADD